MHACVAPSAVEPLSQSAALPGTHRSPWGSCFSSLTPFLSCAGKGREGKFQGWLCGNHHKGEYFPPLLFPLHPAAIAAVQDLDKFKDIDVIHHHNIARHTVCMALVAMQGQSWFSFPRLRALSCIWSCSLGSYCKLDYEMQQNKTAQITRKWEKMAGRPPSDSHRTYSKIQAPLAFTRLQWSQEAKNCYSDPPPFSLPGWRAGSVEAEDTGSLLKPVSWQQKKKSTSTI